MIRQKELGFGSNPTTKIHSQFNRDENTCWLANGWLAKSLIKIPQSSPRLFEPHSYHLPTSAYMMTSCDLPNHTPHISKNQYDLYQVAAGTAGPWPLGILINDPKQLLKISKHEQTKKMIHRIANLHESIFHQTPGSSMCSTAGPFTRVLQIARQRVGTVAWPAPKTWDFLRLTNYRLTNS